MILQSFWNSFKIKLLSVIDKVVPYSTFVSQSIIQKVLNPWIKNKLNKRTRLLKLFNKTKTINLKTKIRSLDKEIRDFFRKQKNHSLDVLLFQATANHFGMLLKLQKILMLMQYLNLCHLVTKILIKHIC